jgi:hypothetical protein
MYATSCATTDSMCHEPRVPRQHQLPIHRVYSTAKMEARGLLTGLDARSYHAAPLTAVGCLCIAPIGTTRAAQPARGRYSIRGARYVNFLLLKVRRTCRCGSDRSYSNRRRMSPSSALQTPRHRRCCDRSGRLRVIEQNRCAISFAARLFVGER